MKDLFYDFYEVMFVGMPVIGWTITAICAAIAFFIVDFARGPEKEVVGRVVGLEFNEAHTKTIIVNGKPQVTVHSVPDDFLLLVDIGALEPEYVACSRYEFEKMKVGDPVKLKTTYGFITGRNYGSDLIKKVDW